MEREELTFPSGGETCAAYLFRPPAAAGDVPCVVMAHGFTGTRDERLPAFAERFAQAGLAALVFDYRHFGASTGEPRQVLDIGRQLEDYRAAIRFARTLTGVDPERIALWGSSFSGGHVLTLTAQDPSIAAAVVQVPFADGIPTVRLAPLRNALRGTLLGIADRAGALVGRPPVRIPVIGAPGTFAVMTAPEAKPGFEAIVPPGSLWRNEVAARIMLRVGTYRPLAGADRIACPLLVCVAERDETAPPAPGIRAAERAPRGELKLYPYGHFEVYVGEPFEQVVADQVEFLARQVRPAPAPTAATA
jgi:dienelactone hydrolase